MFAELYLQTAHVQRPGALDRYGQPTYGEAVAFRCRFQPSNRLIRNADGAQVAGEAVLYTNEPVTTDDLVFPPGSNPADPDHARSPMKVDVFFDLLTGAESYRAVHI